MVEIMSAGSWKTNAELIADVAKLGWLNGLVLDTTHGKGNFWTTFQPADLWRNDLHVSPADFAHDVRELPEQWAGMFDAVVFDPPYKLNGRAGSVPSDSAYGVATPATRDERVNLILDGAAECVRVTRPGGFVHVKVQNQICGGRFVDLVRMVQTRLLDAGGVVQRAQWFLVAVPRPQPPGRAQVNPRNNVSTLLSFERVN